MKITPIAAAVVAVLSTAAAHAAGSCASPDYAVYIAGSSAAKNALKTGLANDLFAGSPTVYSSSNGDFEAFCGAISTSNATLNTDLGAAPTSGQIVTVYYRAEGGSVLGALPIVSGNAVNFLDLTGTCSSTTTPQTTGTSNANGTTDTWGGCVTTHVVEMGITDVEPSQLVGSNYPTTYCTAVFGSASPAQLVALTSGAVRLFDQVFGIFVNTSGINGSTATNQPLNLSKETVAAIMHKSYTDWSGVPTASGTAVSNVSAPIHILNREAGSGTRTAATIYFLGANCSTTPLSLPDAAPQNDSYSTSAVLGLVASTAGGVSYASIDQANTGNPGASVTLVTISGQPPSALAAASGQYDFWYEATGIRGKTFTAPGSSGITTYLLGGDLSSKSLAPTTGQIVAIPGVSGNVASLPLAASPVYVNLFTRSKNSCNIPAEQTE